MGRQSKGGRHVLSLLCRRNLSLGQRGRRGGGERCSWRRARVHDHQLRRTRRRRRRQRRRGRQRRRRWRRRRRRSDSAATVHCRRPKVASRLSGRADVPRGHHVAFEAAPALLALRCAAIFVNIRAGIVAAGGRGRQRRERRRRCLLASLGAVCPARQHGLARCELSGAEHRPARATCSTWRSAWARCSGILGLV